MMLRKRNLLASLACVAAGSLIGCMGLSPGERAKAVKEPAPAFDFAKMTVKDAKVTRTSKDGCEVLKVETAPATEGWAYVELPAAQPWDFSARRFVAAQVRNLKPETVHVTFRADSAVPSADGKIDTAICASAELDVQQNWDWSWTMAALRRHPDHVKVNLFGMMEQPWRLAGQNEKGVDPSKITKVIFAMPHSKDGRLLEIRNFRPVGWSAPLDVSADPAKFFPCVDEFGQYRHGEWREKVHSVEELVKRRDEEAKDLAANTPAGWDKYGGWESGPQLKATGFFYTAKHEGKWWLVDPEGRLFFSIGFCCVNWMNPTVVEERDAWFANLPALEAQFKNCSVINGPASGHFAGRQVRCFDYAMANIMRKYGPDWATRYPEVANSRLRSWGMNTVANWSMNEVIFQHRNSYVCPIWLWNLKTLPGGFYDVFDAGFRPTVTAEVAQVGKPSLGDPWCIGYYVDNELPWGRDDTSLAVSAVTAPPDQPAKATFIEDLKAKYETIEKLNAAWGASHASWDALRAATAAPDANKAKADLLAFQERICEVYFKTIREAVKAAAPNQLYLGSRFYLSNVPVLKAAVKYCDVVSYNLYRPSIADFKLPVDADVPLIVGEFGFGAADASMLGGWGLLVDQESRAAAYKSYLAGALKHPQFVGCHWFLYRDEPTTARSYDHENFQFGFVDMADTPYQPMVEAARDVGKTMYKTRLNGR